MFWFGISAESIQRDITFQSNSLALKDSLGYTYPSVTGCFDIELSDALGKPIVPIKSISILVPSDAANTEISYQVIKSETLHIENIPFPTQPPKLTLETDDLFINPDTSVYSSNELYPRSSGKIVNISEKNGWKIVKMDVYPIQYITADSLLIFNEITNYNVSCERDGSITNVPKFIIEDSKEEIYSIVENKEMIEGFTPLTTNFMEQATYDYIVIVKDEWKNHVQALVDWKTKKGIKAKCVTLEEIYSSITSPFLDRPAKVRKAIELMRDNWGSQWFLLVGQDDDDDENWFSYYTENVGEFCPRRDLVPEEVGFHPEFIDLDTIAGDIYFSNLDGDWDYDGDGTFGEQEDSRHVDLLSDVNVGRILAQDTVQVKNYANKIINYERNYPIEEPNKIILVLDTDFDDDGLIVYNEYINRDNFNVELFRKKIGTCDETALLNSIESGAGYISFFAHGWMDKVVTEDNGISNEDLLTMFSEPSQQKGTYNICLATSCCPGAYDYESLTENWLHGTASGNGGTIATIFNYRLGIGGGIIKSNKLNAEFLKIISNYYGKGNLKLGEVFNEIKNNYGTLSHWNFGWNLYGDPEIPLYTGGPYQFEVKHDTVLGIEYTDLTIEVLNKVTREPLDSAYVCCYIEYDGSEVNYNDYSRGYTDSEGNYIFNFKRKDETGKVFITVSRQNYLVYEGICKIQSRQIAVNYNKEIPVFTDSIILVEVTKISASSNDGLENAKVVLSNSEDIYFETFTDENGIAQIPVNIVNTKGITVEVFSEYNYYGPEIVSTEYEGNINPYMWSTLRDATGPNGSNHLVRNSKNGYLYLIYSDGDSIVTAKSINFGKSWQLQKIGHGSSPSITEIIDGTNVGIAAVWKDGESWVYDWSMSPWVGEDTVSPTVMGYRNPVITANPSNRTEVWLGGIMTNYGTMDNYWTLQYAGFNYRNPDASQITEIIGEEGDYNSFEDYLAKPYNNASIGSKLWGSLYGAVIAFEDTNGEIIEKQFDARLDVQDWLTSTNKSNTSTKSTNPYIDRENITDINKVIWQEELLPGQCQIFLDNEVFEFANTTTDKRYPKIAKGIVSYIENGRTLVFNPKILGQIKDVSYFYEDSISYPNIVTKSKYLIDELVYDVASIATMKFNGIYKIITNLTEFSFSNSVKSNPIPIALEDTSIIKTDSSYLVDYIEGSGKQKIERIKGVITGLNKYKDYILEAVTTNNSSNHPYVLIVDETLKSVIYGKEKTTTIFIDSSMYEDGELEIIFERLKGNPNRQVNINLYEYDEMSDATVISTSLNLLKMKKSTKNPREVVEVSKLNNKFINIAICSSSDKSIIIDIYDVSGRNIIHENKMLNQGKNNISLTTGKLSSGIYFYRLGNDGEEITSGKLTVIK